MNSIKSIVGFFRSWRAGFVPAIVACTAASATAQHPFTEEGIQRGIGDYIVQDYLPSGDNASGYGIALADLDNNGQPDLLASGAANGKVGIWRNDGTGHFIDVSDQSGIPLLLQSNGFGIGDYDGDGFLDVVVTRYYGYPVRLYRNLGNFQFEDTTAQAGIDNTWRSEDANFGDYNLSGWLDLYIANYCIPFNLCATGFNRLYENQGDGTFIDVAPKLGVHDKGAGMHAIFYDFDRDGWPDLYVSNDRGHVFLFLDNRFYHNVGGSFVDISEQSNTDYAAYSMGCSVGDLSLTGWDDIYCTNIGSTTKGSGYMINHDGLNFTLLEDLELQEETGMGNQQGAGWCAASLDFNNNGLLDLFVCNTNNVTANRLYQNQGSFPFVDVAQLYNVAINKKTHTIALADLTGNGALDFVHNAMDDRLRLYVNHQGALRNWIKIRINGEWPNHFAIGSMVDLRVGTKWQHRQLAGGNNYKGENHYIVHFGVGSATMIDEIVIQWPGKSHTKVLTNVPANQTLVVDPPRRIVPQVPGDLNGDGVVNVFDLLILLESWGPCPDPADCVADLNGDGDVNVFDLLILLENWGLS